MMAPPSQLAILTSSVERLIKEEASYHKELAQQEQRLERMIASDSTEENAEFQVKQERAAIEETKAVFPPLCERIEMATDKLADKLEAEEGSAPEAEVTKAKEFITKAKALKDTGNKKEKKEQEIIA
ncbi:tubulin binding cofactor A [Calycina marina]|uniref:Tubulin-specific chaperone A n=1 Tax=Calycina marina TaxID=1763456 RepID=A0A9P8CDB4_9HELO|nr:tubulin binding cofactor A [Calycina marina]